MDWSSAPGVVAKMHKYPRPIKGGLCARPIERYDIVTERRFSVYHGKSFGDDIAPPPLVFEAHRGF
jgi:hypothetical protein